jgi:hypothetical protein
MAMKPVVVVIIAVFLCGIMSCSSDDSKPNIVKGTVPVGTGTGTSTGTGTETGTGTGTTTGSGELTISPSPHKPAGTQAAVDKALAFLDATGGDFPEYESEATGKLVITSFCGLALMASGSTPAEGPYKNTIRYAANFVAANISYPGMSGVYNQSNWHVSIGAIFLAEAYKATGDNTYKVPLQESVTRLAEAQEPSWGYAGGPHTVCSAGYLELEIISNWVITAMAAAEKCGCTFDHEKFTNAMKYVTDKCTFPSGSGSLTGAVFYSHKLVRDASPCRTGGAIMALHLAGNTKHRDIMTGYLKGEGGSIHTGHGSASMGYLSGALGCLATDQETWDAFVKSFFQRILDHQKSSGSFPAFDGQPGANQDYLCGPYYITGILTHEKNYSPDGDSCSTFIYRRMRQQ